MILVVDRFKRNAVPVSDMLYYMGFLSKPTTHVTALSEISPLYRALIIMSPEKLPDAWDFMRRVHLYYKELPIFAFGNPDKSYIDLFAKVLDSPPYAASIVSDILSYNADNKLLLPGDYRLMGLDVSASLSVPKYFDSEFPLTKVEAMIVRYLIRTYPRPTPSIEILKHCFRESRMPEASGIRTHVSLINKKFRAIADRNLIALDYKTGYRIHTPEISALPYQYNEFIK